MKMDLKKFPIPKQKHKYLQFVIRVHIFFQIKIKNQKKNQNFKMNLLKRMFLVSLPVIC